MKSSGGTTPFPNVLLDVFMPRLSDSAFRVLSVVVRQTLGWSAFEGARKGEDWLSHKQLQLRTGRASEAVSRAIQELIDKGLIRLRGEEGQILSRAQDRERYRGRIYFALTTGVLGLASTLNTLSVAKPKATKENLTKEKLPRHGNWQRAVSGPRTQHPPNPDSL